MPEVDPRTDARRREHPFLLLVVDEDIIQHEAVETAQVDTSYTHLRAQLPACRTGRFAGEETLYCRQVQQYDGGEVETCHGPYHPPDNCSEFLQCVYKTTKKTVSAQIITFKDDKSP